jgi:hypothetical protein
MIIVKQRRTLVLVGLVLVVLATAVLVAGCGGPGTKVYANPAYGYSISYPGDWATDTNNTALTAGTKESGNVAVYDPEGTQVDGVFVDLALVSVYPLQNPVSDPWTGSTRSEVEGLLSQLQTQTPGMQVDKALEQTTLASLRGFVVSYTFTKGSTPMHSTLYFLFDDTREYELDEQSAVAAPDDTKAQLHRVIDGFKPGKSK